MTTFKPEPAPPIHEPCPVSSVWVDGLSVIQTVGAVTHLIFTEQRPEVQGDEPKIERVVQARLIVPTEQLQAIGRALLSGKVDTPHVGVAGRPVEFH
jgi:hypothetical protein